MPRPQLAAALTWGRLEKEVHVVFEEALRRLAVYSNLPAGEMSINLWLHWLALRVHQEKLRLKEVLIPFIIDPDSTSKPEPEDSPTASRLKKRPDFACIMKNEHDDDFRKTQISYYVECKRLSQPEKGRVFFDLYSEEGITRFLATEHQYAKGCTSASMIGYLQNTDPAAVLKEVNKFATGRSIPSLAQAAAAWVAKHPNRLTQAVLTRQYDPSTIRLHHFWIDLRHVTFDVPYDQVPASASPLPPPPKPIKWKKKSAKEAFAARRKKRW